MNKGKMHTVIVNGQEEEVELKPITLFYGYDFTLKVPEAIEIDSRSFFGIAQGLNEQDLKVANNSGIFRSCFNAVFKDPNIPMPKTLLDFKSEGSGVQSVFVMVMLILNSIVQNVELWKQGKCIINIKYPETCLHPREQANLGDLLIKLAMPGGFIEVQDEFDTGGA